MIRFTLQAEPANFEQRCRQRGRQWLADHPQYRRLYDYWSEFENDLRQAFRNLCAYCAMTVMRAEVDHFVPVAVFRKTGQHYLAYEWSNFRYGEGTLNRRKQDLLLLDPFEVEDDWFRIELPSLQLVATEKVPVEFQERTQLTLQRLGLGNGPVVIRYRQQWFKLYQDGKLSLEGLREVAPQIARTVEEDLRRDVDWRKPR